MKQLVVEKNNPTPILWDTPIPNPGPGEILIKNHYSVVSSGTELAAIEVANTSVTDKLQNSSNIDKGLDLLKKEGIGAVWNAVFPKNLLPLQLGYSSAGEVVKVGKGVSAYHVGDKVVSNGGHAEYVVVSENLCSRIDENTDIKEAAFTVLGSIALHGLRLSETSLGSKVVVVGLGVIGQLVCRLAEAQGSEVIGIDPDPERSKYGDNFFTSADDVELKDVDSVIITAATSSNEPIELATKIARNKAKIVVIGDIPLNISRNDFYYTENRNFEAFTKLLSQKQIHLLDLVSEEIAFEDAPSVYEKFEDEIKPLSVVLRYNIDAEPKIKIENDLQPEPKTSKVNVGILGAGNFAATTIMPALKELKRECKILGVASSKGLSAKSLAKSFKIKNKYSTEEEILNADEIDAVLILTPHHNHSDLVIKALNKGKAVYVEKPLALDMQSITDIEESIYRSENPKLFIGFNRRFSKSAQFIKQKLINNPANSINLRFSVPPLDSDHWTNIKEIGGGRIVGEAVHGIDLACFLFDSLPQSISASAPVDKTNNMVKDNQVFLNINFANGSHASLQYFSEANQILSKERIEVHGEGNSYILEDFKMLRFLEGSQDRSKTFSTGKGHKESLSIFFDYVRDKSQNPFTWEEIKAVSKAAIIAQDHINSGQQHNV